MSDQPRGEGVNGKKSPCRVHKWGTWTFGRWNGGIGHRRVCRRCGAEQTR
jgi:hypothetical protein